MQQSHLELYHTTAVEREHHQSEVVSYKVQQ